MLKISQKFSSKSAPLLKPQSMMKAAASWKEKLAQRVPSEDQVQTFNSYAAVPCHVSGYVLFFGGGVGLWAVSDWIRDTISDGDKLYKTDFAVLAFRVSSIAMAHCFKAAYGSTAVPFQQWLVDSLGVSESRWEQPQSGWKILKQDIHSVVRTFFFGDLHAELQNEKKTGDQLRLELNAFRKASREKDDAIQRLEARIEEIQNEKIQEVAEAQRNSSQLMQAARVSGTSVLLSTVMVCACIFLSIRRHDALRPAFRSCKRNLRAANKKLMKQEHDLNRLPGHAEVSRQPDETQQTLKSKEHDCNVLHDRHTDVSKQLSENDWTWKPSVFRANLAKLGVASVELWCLPVAVFVLILSASFVPKWFSRRKRETLNASQEDELTGVTNKPADKRNQLDGAQEDLKRGKKMDGKNTALQNPQDLNRTKDELADKGKQADDVCACLHKIAAGLQQDKLHNFGGRLREKMFRRLGFWR